MPPAEWMRVQTESQRAPGSRADGTKPLSLRDRMRYSGWLVGTGGFLAFLGFIFVAYGVYWFGVPPSPVYGCFTSPCEGLWWNQIIAIGLVFIGLGLFVSLIGVAVRGPSLEWSEVAEEPAVETGEIPRRRGIRFACPGCGGDVYLGEGVCASCGYQLSATPG